MFFIPRYLYKSSRSTHLFTPLRYIKINTASITQQQRNNDRGQIFFVSYFVLLRHCVCYNVNYSAIFINRSVVLVHVGLQKDATQPRFGFWSSLSREGGVRIALCRNARRRQLFRGYHKLSADHLCCRPQDRDQ